MSHNSIKVNAQSPDATGNISQSLDNLSDVVISNAGVGEVLRYNGTNFVDAQLASTDLSDTADLARLASPALTGTPTATTATQGDSSIRIATTAFVTTAVAGAGGGGAPSVTSGSPATTYAITDTSTAHQVYLLTPTANIDVTLPSASTAGSGARYDVKNLTSGFSLTLKGQTGDNIDGVAPATGIIIGTQYESLTVISDGSEWFII